MSVCAGCGGELDSVVLVVDPEGLSLDPKSNEIRVRTASKIDAEKDKLKVFCLRQQDACRKAMKADMKIDTQGAMKKSA